MCTVAPILISIETLHKIPQPVSDALSENPRPIVFADQRLVVFWSGKSACTTTLRWSFHHMGLLEAADYFGWIHQFRTKVYYESRRYKNSVAKYRQEKYRHIRVVRDPFSRVVSAYLHALQQGYETERIQRFLGENRGFTFREFVAFLHTVDLAHDNIHFSLQSTAAQRRGDLVLDEVIRIEDGLERRLGQVEARLGLPATDFTVADLRSKHRNNYSALPSFFGDVAHQPGQKPSAPSYEWFYDSELVDQVATLFASDFSLYGYSRKLPSRVPVVVGAQSDSAA